ncbi:MAG: UvrD-helicase domain-containing protein [Nitrososphaera sp.]|nr:UvrD-helicase domain-containing protein [Nitrososphaera sp.]
MIFPSASVIELLRDPFCREAIASKLTAETDSEFHIGPPDGVGLVARITKFHNQAYIVGIWRIDNREPISLKGTPLLSIWTNPEESSVGALDEDRAEVLERLCQLAVRLWDNLTLPKHWEPKKIDTYPSIFARDRRLMDIRVAYLVRTESGRKVIDIGMLYGRRNKSPVCVPSVEAKQLARLPELIELSDEKRLPLVRVEHHSEPRPDDRDLVLQVPSGDSCNLFSMSYLDWISDSGPLTRNQRHVIRHKIHRPLRIHGPAGCGKTLVLILKTLALLNQARDEGTECQILFVAHSTAMRNTIRAAFEAIDDYGFLATNRDDPQFLDIETLHGWCIRELGLEHDLLNYVLEADPIISKERQRQVLEEVVQDVLGKKYSTSKQLLSTDFMARLDGNREHLLQDVGWEIAIRIKGRGFRRSDQKLFVDSSMKSFVGRGENKHDRHFIFHIYQMYETQFEEKGLLDTDDVVLSMAARLSVPLWDRQRRVLGYDYVMVDEVHLFNENERRVLPQLTRGNTEWLPLVMTFDEAQSIGGRRSFDLAKVGIEHSEKKTLTLVHRSSPEILAFAHNLLERSPLVLSQFDVIEPVATMSTKERKRCQKPSISYAVNDSGILESVATHCNDLRSHKYYRVGVIAFDAPLLNLLRSELPQSVGPIQNVKERGELTAALPKSGTYLMSPETCGGLEFDAVVLVGVEEGRLPPSMGELSAQGYLSIEEEAYKEVYTAVTRARYRLLFICDSRRGLSSLILPSVTAGLIEERL